VLFWALFGHTAYWIAVRKCRAGEAS